MHFASDNAGPVHPLVMAALIRANDGYQTAYGVEAAMDAVRARLRGIFEAPDAEVHLVATGTAANVLLLSTLTAPFETIFCAEAAHIVDSECNAPEFYTGGAKLTLVPTVDGKIMPDALHDRIDSIARKDIHNARRGPLSLTQVTETGSVYSIDELRVLTGIAHDRGLPVHLDGARFTNALVALGCSAAEMTWKAGIDAVSFGGTKNGLMGVEAMILFAPQGDKGTELQYRRKRGAHLFSKHRYLSAQMQAYLEDDLWREMAQAANARSAHLRTAFRELGHPVIGDPQANLFFAMLPRETHVRLQASGAEYYVWGDLAEGDPADLLKARFVTDWSLPEADLDRFVALLRAA